MTPVISKQKSKYLNFVSFGNSEEIENFYYLKNLPSVLGSSLFKDSIKEKFASLINLTEVPESKSLAPSPNKVVICVIEQYKITKEELFFSKRGTENLPRDLAIYLVRRLCYKTLPQVGKGFGIDNYSTVSSVVQRVKSRVAKDKDLQKEVEMIKGKVLLG